MKMISLGEGLFIIYVLSYLYMHYSIGKRMRLTIFSGRHLCPPGVVQCPTYLLSFEATDNDELVGIPSPICKRRKTLHQCVIYYEINPKPAAYFVRGQQITHTSLASRQIRLHHIKTLVEWTTRPFL